MKLRTKGTPEHLSGRIATTRVPEETIACGKKEHGG